MVVRPDDVDMGMGMEVILRDYDLVRERSEVLVEDGASTSEDETSQATMGVAKTAVRPQEGRSGKRVPRECCSVEPQVFQSTERFQV